MRGALVLLLATTVCGLAQAAAAQTAVHPRGVYAAPIAPALAASPAPTPPAAAPAGRLTLQGLPDRSDGAPACRAQCARARSQCEAVDDACAPVWTACLRRCAAAR